MDLNDASQIRSNNSPEVRERVIYGTGCIFELTKWLFVFIIAILMINFFVATIFVVEGLSMEPNFHTGEFIVADRWQYLFGKPQRGDAVTLKFPGDPEHKKYIKRVIGLPGETVTIMNGFVFINGKKLSEPYLAAGTVTLPNMSRVLAGDDYFLLGDNRDNSSDSRIWGVAPRRDLIGRAWIIIWPLKNFGFIPEYGRPSMQP